MNYLNYYFDELLTNRLSLLNLRDEKPIRNIQNEFLYYILNWNPEWFCDEKCNKTVPSVINDIQMIPTQLQYSSIEEYQNVMLPMLIHEFWHVLKQDFEELARTKKKTEIIEVKCPKASQGITLFDDQNDHKIFSFTATAETKSRDYPRQGNLVILTSTNPVQTSSVFAYIHDLKERSIKDGSDIVSILKFELLTNASIRNSEISEFSLTTVSFLLQHLSLIDTLQFLPQFSLCQSILYPTTWPYSMSSHITKLHPSLIVTKHDLNAMQKRVMMGVLGNVEVGEPKICLIQGPPGTGKSKTIVNIIGTILKVKSATKILVCAPSNKAVDSLVLQLLDVKPILEEQGLSFRIVRIGNEDKIDDSVKKISLLNQALKQQKIQKMSLYHIKQDILERADIIAGTLTSCYTNRSVMGIFGVCHQSGSTKSPIRICIVDEAAQATELLTMIPLLLGVEQLILVGDPQQLPPLVLSEKAKSFGYGTSLFSRAEKIFGVESVNPIITLNTQYRMTESISEWPNAYFYKGILKNSASINPLGICKYKLFNHKFSQDVNGYTNQGEAELVVQVATLLKLNLQTTEDSISIGIITPYQKQRELICELLESTDSEKDIEVNTVDSFQGSERDIIIMSCVRSSGLGFTNDPNRLCVSLTRAKHTLIMIGNFKAFRVNKMWKSLINDAVQREVLINIEDKNAKSALEKDLIINNLKGSPLKVYK